MLKHYDFYSPYDMEALNDTNGLLAGLFLIEVKMPQQSQQQVYWCLLYRWSYNIGPINFKSYLFAWEVVAGTSLPQSQLNNDTTSNSKQISFLKQ